MEQLNLHPNQLMQKYERHYPESFFCSLSLEKMTNPILHQCGKSYEEAIIRDWIGRKSTCPNCRAEARIEDFKPNLDLKTAIEEFPEKVLRVIEKADNKIVSLENDKVVLGNERDQAINESVIQKQGKDEAVNKVEEQERVINDLEGEVEYRSLKKENTKLRDQLLLERKHGLEGIGGWKTRLFVQKKDSKARLDLLFNGLRMFGLVLERPNFFIKSNSSNNERVRSQEIFEELLRLKKQDIQQLTVKRMSAYEGIYEYSKVSFDNQEHEKFILPMLEELIENGQLIKRTINQTIEYGVTIKDKPIDGWNVPESDRYFPKTYEDTLKEILSESLRYEVCEQISSILR